MPTPTSASTAYASSAEFVARYDVRSVCELCSDNDEPVDPSLLATNARLLACLKDASGMVEAACGVADSYTVDDLQALTGVSLSMLKRLVCDITMGLLFMARPDRIGDPPKMYDRAMETLKDIRNGQLVFGLQEVRDAGQLDVDIESPDEVTTRGGIVVEAGRYFSRRTNRLGPWR